MGGAWSLLSFMGRATTLTLKHLPLGNDMRDVELITYLSNF